MSTDISAIKRLPRARSIATAALLVALVATSCSDGSQQLADSTAPVLVTTDSKFLNTLQVTGADAPDNYLVRSNSSAEFDPEVDPSLAIESYQINDAQAWSDSKVESDKSLLAALHSVIADASAMRADGPCISAAEDPQVLECTYDVGQVEPFPMLVRRVGTTDLVVIGNQPQGLDYISGDFEAVTPEDAATRFPRS